MISTPVTSLAEASSLQDGDQILVQRGDTLLRAPASLLGAEDDSRLTALESDLASLSGYTVLLAGLTSVVPTFTGPTTQARSTLKAVAPAGTTGTVLVTQGELSTTLTINGAASAVALASGQSTTFAGTISGGGAVAVMGA